ncbi:cytochrome p450 [Trichoderma cornu-damae]|uniref:Cytochrome p450 n=1 Tax=Trichoderma cornu-damae TaxID=654480 RepID=A0A9P8QUJ5_9HYPO|nr:cytochrome p450 [Trichoderma cornu-damae]
MALAEKLGSLTSTQIWAISALFLILSFVADFASHPHYPNEIPVMGKGRGKLNALLDSFRYITSYRRWVRNGYVKFGKKGLPFVVPTPLSRPQEVIIPRNQIAWMIDQPDNVLSSLEAHNAMLYTEYNFFGRRFSHDPFPNLILHKHLPRHLPTIIPNLDDEVQHAVSKALGNDTENWKSVKLWNLWLEIVPHVTSRLLIGPEICRNKQFIDGMVNFTNDVIRNSLLMQFLPRVLHPIVGPLLSISNHLHWHSAHIPAQPIIQKRLNAMIKKAAGDAEFKYYTPPEDYVTWFIRQALAEERTFDLDPVVLSKRLLPLEFAAIHTTVLTGQLWMQDLLASDPGSGILDILRAEINAHKPESGPWNKAAISSLVRLDSSIRESQRVSNFTVTVIERKVVSDKGLYNPDLGWTLPKGSFITANLDGTHHDMDLYENAESYDPLRYSRSREAWDAKSDEEKNSEPEEDTPGK